LVLGAIHGPAVELADTGLGRALVCTASAAFRSDPTTAYITRRSLPDGAVQWAFPTQAPVTALETDDAGTIVFATLAPATDAAAATADERHCGTLLVLDAETGRPLWHLALRVDGWPTIGLSLAHAAPDRLLIGTVDGHILDLETGI
jgi:outer membrane protein assembly factor BamB